MCNYVQVHEWPSRRTARQIEVVSATGEHNIVHVCEPYGMFGIFYVWSVKLNSRDDKSQVSNARSQLEDSFPPYTFYQAIRR